MTDDDVFRIARNWPGKSHGGVHPALWHMLDVGAVAATLCASHRLSGRAGTDRALCFLVALHDIGKISHSFRAMLRDGRRQPWRHWQHSAEILWCHDALIGEAIGGDPVTRAMLYEAVAGHHGGPRMIEDHGKREQQSQEIGADAMRDAALAITAITRLFPGASLDGMDELAARVLSWKVNGLTVQADWIGSNTCWFPATPPDIALCDYWESAQSQAAKAIEAAGLCRASPASSGEATVLARGFTPHPMQAEAGTTALPDGPMLAVIEDATGAGKTEAALILAARMMAAGKARGLFFALPSMATANAMLSRLELATPGLFDGAPTLALSHGRAHLSEAFREIKGRDGSNPESGPHCGRWLSDDRRRVLLADVGVGTIDQALLAVLPTRFNGLRLRALAEKVLIVDEAHSYDPYMEAQLTRLLRFQAKLGGSAVVMTATLPAKMKAGFVMGFQQGLAQRGRPSRKHLRVSDPIGQGPYPALTIVGKRAGFTAVDPAAPTVRRVAVTRLTEAAQAVDLICEARKQGAACIWIRNAVDDAISAVEALREIGIEAELLHARFAVCDRLAKEQALQIRFGRTGRDRAGRVLVATQVAEQSLDLDFDVMVSDLAPIGSMIQRAGRLWRHMGDRPAATRPVAGPQLHVLSPDPENVPDAGWLHRVLDKGAYVYPPPEQWRSAKVLFDAGEIRAPDGLRALIEAVHGAEPLALPEVLETAEFEYEGQQLVERQLAVNSLLNPDEPFNQERMGKVWDDEQFPTRLGVPQVTLALAIEGQKGLVPYAGTEKEERRDGWAMSELQLSAAKFGQLDAPDQTRPDIRAAKSGWPEARAKYTIVAPLGSGGRICKGLRYDAELGAIWE